MTLSETRRLQNWQHMKLLILLSEILCYVLTCSRYISREKDRLSLMIHSAYRDLDPILQNATERVASYIMFLFDSSIAPFAFDNPWTKLTLFIISDAILFKLIWSMPVCLTFSIDRHQNAKSEDKFSQPFGLSFSIEQYGLSKISHSKRFLLLMFNKDIAAKTNIFEFQ